MEDTTKQFIVNVVFAKTSLRSKTVNNIAHECYMTGYIKKQNNTKYYFNVESDAMEFVAILNLHPAVDK